MRARDAVLLVAGAVATGGSWALLRRGPVPGGRDRWARSNHAGQEVTLLEGVALVTGGTFAAPVLAAVTRRPRLGWAVLATTAGPGVVGALDDLDRAGVRKGLAGHLGALLRGEVTTGALKVLVLAGSGLAAVGILDRGDRPGGRGGWGLAGTLLGAAGVAGCANLANLLDLRPGRALKAAGAGAAGLALTGPGSPTGAAVLGSVAVLLPDDLAGRAMLGDTGANPLGALVGLAAVDRLGTRGRLVLLLATGGLTLVSERVSFSAVIDRTPLLRELDALGRVPPARRAS